MRIMKQKMENTARDYNSYITMTAGKHLVKLIQIRLELVHLSLSDAEETEKDYGHRTYQHYRERGRTERCWWLQQG